MGASSARTRRSVGAAAPAPGEATGRARGRPRRPAVEDLVLRATMELLHEKGAGGATINAIAARSGCSKSTIYRRWATRDDIVLDALRLAVQGRSEDIDRVVEMEAVLGSPIHAAALRGSRAFGGRLMAAVLPLIIRELFARSALGEAFRTEIFGPIRDGARHRLRDAIDRGEIANDVDADLVFDLIYGGMLYRALVHEPLDDDVAHAAADLLMRGAAGPRYAQARRRQPAEPV